MRTSHYLRSHPVFMALQISSELDVPRVAVDSWIVRAVGRRLFAGKIDQVTYVIYVGLSCGK